MTAASAAPKRPDCRYCGSAKPVRFLSLGAQPPSNSFLKPEDVSKELSYPLDVYWCPDCALVQLLDVVPAGAIFDDYLYLASSSKALVEHYAGLCGWAVQSLGLKAGDLVVDIGCNDGVLLKGWPESLRRVGVEPSKVAAHAERAGFEVFRGFFGSELAGRIVERHGRARAVTATNVFAHVDDIASFAKATAGLLADDGVFLIEAPYLLDTIDSLLYDTIYHEHLCYLALTPMAPFFERCGLQIVGVSRVPFGASGPAIRVAAQRRGGPRAVDASVRRMLADEEAWGIRREETFRAYAAKVDGVNRRILELLSGLRAKGERVGAFCAPAKGNTLLNSLKLTSREIECVAEDNPLKVGLVTPGSHIPIVSDAEFLRRRPPYALLLAWNYVDFFLKKAPYVQNGGKFLVPLPDPKLAP